MLPVPVSPASPEKAIKVCLFSGLVLSSDALRIVGPRIAAFEAAMMVKSLPVIPNRTSLCQAVSNSILVIPAVEIIGYPHGVDLRAVLVSCTEVVWEV